MLPCSRRQLQVIKVYPCAFLASHFQSDAAQATQGIIFPTWIRDPVSAVGDGTEGEQLWEVIY